MAGTERLHPSPKGPFPTPESYASASCGPNPERPRLVSMGTVITPVPATILTVKPSPVPRNSPPPLGSEMVGAENVCSPRPVPSELATIVDPPFQPVFTSCPRIALSVPLGQRREHTPTYEASESPLDGDHSDKGAGAPGPLQSGPSGGRARGFPCGPTCDIFKGG